ncbi:MAG TPA: MBL fold metallo-hydrolase [Gemmatimonadales bacterium]|nr:MBL fold metallo-hydrolase [Gemmatimonadales bacterium]
MLALREPCVVTVPNGRYLENCYLVADPVAERCVVIDPGEDPDPILAALRHRGWQVEGIWLTHGHMDHVLGVPAVREMTGAPIWLHPDDRFLYETAPQFGPMPWEQVRLPAPDHPLAHGQRVPVGALAFEVRHTPGHSPGSVCFVGHGLAFVGDVLFAGSVGRTDLPGGDHQTLIDSIARELLTLPDATVAYPGHGRATTIGVERATNPFLRPVRSV